MRWLKKRIDFEWNENGDVDCETIAREFAERALRVVARIGHPNTPLGHSSLWAVSAMMPCVDNLYGLGFASEAEAEAWLAKSIAAVLAAADVEG